MLVIKTLRLNAVGRMMSGVMPAKDIAAKYPEPPPDPTDAYKIAMRKKAMLKIKVITQIVT